MDSATLLQAQGIKKAFGGQIVLDSLDLRLHRGEVVLLRGENGSGKTTLLNILTGNLEPDAGILHYLADSTPRSYHFPRRWWQDINPFDHFTPEFVAREGVCRTWQDVRLFDTQTLRDNIAVAEPGHPGENPFFALFAQALSARREKHIDREADTVLARLGLAGRERSSADRISLGQSKRVAIARAMAAGARILFLDEPLAGLDRQGIAHVIELLGALVDEEQLTLVIVEHIFNQWHLEGLVTTDWLLEGGRILNVGRFPTAKHSARQGHDNTHPRPIDSSQTSPGAPASCSRFPNEAESPLGGRRSQEKTPILRPPWFQLLAGDEDKVEIIDEPLPRGALLTRIRRSGVFREPARPVLEIQGLLVDRGKRVVIGLDQEGTPTGFDLILYEGEIATLQAPNGWGKSTLIMALAGFIPIRRGTIQLQGRSLDVDPSWARVRAGLRVLPSDRFMFPDLHGREVMKLSGAADADSTGFPVEPPGLLYRKYASLSGGERRQIALAGFHGGVLGLCDEPFDALDGETVRRAAGYLSSAMKTLLVAEPYREERI